MFALLHSIFAFLIITTFLLSGRTEQNNLKDLPTSEAERGDAFIEAWLVLRNDLDSLSRLKVHPALLDHWFEAMPGFLARDAARLATEPVVIVAAAYRLKKLGGAANERAIKRLSATHKNNQVAFALASIQSKKTKAAKTIDRERRILSRVFPHHYRMFLLKEQAVKPLDVENSMYDTWFRIMSDAVKGGARTSLDMVAKIKSEMASSSSVKDAEIRRRHLSALSGFWKQVDLRISSTKEHPSWPTDFAQAMTAIRASNRDQEHAPRNNERRVTAAIALCSSLGKILGYDRLTFESQDLSVLTSGAGRAFDGNFATSWHVTDGKTLVLLNETGLTPKGLWVSNFCPANKDTRILSFLITGRDGKTSWTKKAQLKLDTDYFQYIDFKNKKAKRIEIEIGNIQGKPPSCIAEIRLEMK